MNEIIPAGTDAGEYFDDLLKKDSEFKEEWEEYQPEYAAMRAVINARIAGNLTQKELAARTGIDQSDISKIERGVRNPTVRLLKKIADALDMELRIEFVPKKDYSTE